MSFGSILRKFREEAGLSRKELADKAGMRSEAGIRDLEQGVNQPSWDTVRKLAKALNKNCLAFDVDEEEGEPEKRPPGRPRKPDVEETPAPAEPKKRGRPRKE